MIKSVTFGVSGIAMKCFGCGSTKIGCDLHGIKFCKDCGTVVEEWM